MENTNRTPRVFFATLGCKVAQYETEALREAFLAEGYTEVREEADIAVVNTCTVTAEADRKCRQAIRRLGVRHPHARILVIGCYAQSHPERVADLPGVVYVGGTADKMKCVAVARSLIGTETPEKRIAVKPLDTEGYEPMSVSSAPRTRAYVKIADGCDCHCTYCAIPAARGPVRSRPREEILSEICRLVAGGTREVVLTGIETASYGRDRQDGYRLIDLLEEVDALPVPRVRLGSLTPEVMRGDFVARLARLTHLAPHFHLSVQSGSSDVLARMKRRYNAEQVMEAILALRAAIPSVQLTCDMIVGFPGESEESFQRTMDFARRARFLSMHVFSYSPRRGTPAATYPDRVGDAEAAARSAALTALAKRMGEEILAEAVARKAPLSVLFETEKGGYATGHTASFLPVTVPAVGVAGEILTVLPTGVQGAAICGTLAGEDTRIRL